MKKKLNLLFVISILCYVLLLGCNGNEVMDNETLTTETESEAGSEVVEEISTEEENSVEASEEDSLKTLDEIEYTNYTNLDDFIEYLKQYDGVIIVQYDFSEEGRPQVLLPNGAHYTISQDDSIRIIPNNKEIEEVQNITYNFVIEPTRTGPAIDFLDKGEEQETSFVVNYADGTSEEFTLYITVE